MVNLVFFVEILQLPHTVISNSEKLTHSNIQYHDTAVSRIDCCDPHAVMASSANPYGGGLCELYL